MDERPSLDIAFELARTAPQELLGYSDALDTKALTLFVAASVIIGVTAALVKDIEINMTLALFIAAFCYYGIVMWKGLRVILPKRMKGLNNPEILRKIYWDQPPNNTKEEYWTYLEKAVQELNEIVESKARAVKWCVLAFPSEVILLVAWVLLQA